MILTTSPAALPGSCYFCGSASRERYVDTNCQVEFHGAMYVCNICVAEMATLMDFITPDAAQVLHRKLEELESQKFEFERKCAGYERALDGLRFAGYDLPDLPLQPPPVAVADEAPAGESPEGENLVGGGEGETPEPADDPQLAGVHASERLDGGPIEFSLDL